MTNYESNYEVVYILRKNILLVKVLWSCYPNPIMRFFKNGVVTFDEKVHCTPTAHGSVGEFFIDPKRTGLALIHFNYDSIETFISRMNKYTSLELEKFGERNIKFSAKLLFTRPIAEFLKRYYQWMIFRNKHPLHSFIEIHLSVPILYNYSIVTFLT